MNYLIGRDGTNFVGDAASILQIGCKVERTGMDEGPLRVVGVDHSRKIVALHHEGYTAYINRATGSSYSPAAITIWRYEIRPNGESFRPPVPEGVYLVKQLIEAPISRVY